MEFYIARNGQKSGPFPLEQVRQQLATGQLSPTDLAWTEGAANWMPISSFPALASAPPPGPPPISPAQTVRGSGLAIPGAASRPEQTSGAAVASLICGIFSIILLPIFFSIPAVICGHVAIGKIRQASGALAGKGMAVAGLIMGYLSMGFVVLLIPILAGIAVPVFAEVQLRGKETRSLSDAKQIGTACKLYALDHGGAYPPNLDVLVPEELPDKKIFTSPLSPGESMAYYYYGGTEKNPPDKVLLMSKFKDRRGKRIMIYSDISGRVALPPPDLLPPPGQ